MKYQKDLLYTFFSQIYTEGYGILAVSLVGLALNITSMWVYYHKRRQVKQRTRPPNNNIIISSRKLFTGFLPAWQLWTLATWSALLSAFLHQKVLITHQNDFQTTFLCFSLNQVSDSTFPTSDAMDTTSCTGIFTFH